ncbi:MAG: hypothetical protein AAB298_07950, partial [Pseudomonadota bacterium]
LPIALGILEASGQIRTSPRASIYAMGELAFSGELQLRDGGFSSRTTIFPGVFATGIRVTVGDDGTAIAAWQTPDAGIYGVLLVS